MAFHALADYQNHVIGWLQWEQSSLGDGAVVRFPRIWMSSGECRLSIWGHVALLSHIQNDGMCGCNNSVYGQSVFPRKQDSYSRVNLPLSC